MLICNPTPKRLTNFTMTPELKTHIANLLSAKKPPAFKPISGGSINQAWQVSVGNEKFFCKINSASKYPELFVKEAAGLQALRDTGCVACPSVITVSSLHDQQILLLEWIDPGPDHPEIWVKFGEQLARLHSWKDPKTPETRFGFVHDNYMGSLPQLNSFTSDWCTFFREQRLAPQVALASNQKLLSPSHMEQFENLYKKLPEIFPPTAASLVHGDLWSGNFLYGQHSQPVLIDPAVYYGHPGMDLAMTTLFGGFNEIFYEVYDHWLPLPVNYADQWAVCNLYPLLIHLNLFGRGYLSAIESCLRRFR